MKNVFYINRVSNGTKNGKRPDIVRREYLRMAGESGRYTWVSEPWEATPLTQCQCCDLMARLTRSLNTAYRYDFDSREE